MRRMHVIPTALRAIRGNDCCLIRLLLLLLSPFYATVFSIFRACIFRYYLSKTFNKLKLSFECGIPLSQDEVTPSLSLLQFLTFIKSQLQCLRTCPYIVGDGTNTFAENCQKLPKMTQICEKSLKTHVKGTKNGCEGLLRAACEKSF
jgi:hypothetical protein